MKVTLKDYKNHLNQSAHGPIELHYALIDRETLECVTPLFKCRDYLNDVVWAHKHKKDLKMYGYQTDFQSYEKVLSQPTMSLVFTLKPRITAGYTSLNPDGTPIVVPPSPEPKPDPTIEEKQAAAIGLLLHKFEDALGFLPSKIDLLEENKYMMITVDMAWTNVPYVMSAMLMLVRLGFTYDPEQDFMEQYGPRALGSKYLSPNDMQMMARCKLGFEELLRNHVDTSYIYDPKDDANRVHNYYGIYHYSNELAVKIEASKEKKAEDPVLPF